MDNKKQLMKRLLMVGIVLSAWGAGSLFAQLETVHHINEDLVESDSDYQYFDLNCNTSPWEGYFAPARWDYQLIQADGPDSVPAPVARQLDDLADGTDRIVIGRHTSAPEHWSIEIPVPGYLSFHLLPANAAQRANFRVSINDRNMALNLRSDGLYYSPYLRQGDRFILHVPAGSATYNWSRLLFHTNYRAVIVRPEEASHSRRYVPIEADLIQRVTFPTNAPGTWPVFDQDGNPTTTEDRRELRASDKQFSVSYTDETVQDGTGYYLRRTFIIRENCSRGNWLRTDRRWVELPMFE